MVIAKKDCKHRVLYKIHSRNLELGVYDETDGGFIGFREKFGDIYLFKEFHRDNGPPYGTVRPQEETKYRLPESIYLGERLPGSKCFTCKKMVKFDEKLEPNDRWFHIEPSDCKNIRPSAIPNIEFDTWMDQVEEILLGK